GAFRTRYTPAFPRRTATPEDSTPDGQDRKRRWPPRRSYGVRIRKVSHRQEPGPTSYCAPDAGHRLSEKPGPAIATKPKGGSGRAARGGLRSDTDRKASEIRRDLPCKARAVAAHA